MRLEQLHYFIVTSNYRSINAAADKLFITQQSLNNSLSAMEKELGYKLLNRSNQGITLTENGELVKKTATEMLKLWEDLQDKIQLPIQRAQEVNSLKLCASPRITELLLPKFINQFQASYPEIQIWIEEERHLNILNGNEDILSYDIIFNTRYYQKHAYLDQYNMDTYEDFVPLFEHKAYLICSKASAVANYKSLTTNTLKHLPLRTYAPKETTESSLDSTIDLYQKLGLSENIIVSNSLSYCLQGVLDNLFYFFCTQGPIARMFDRPELIAIPIQLPFKIFTGYLQVRDKPLSSIAQRFIKLIEDEVRSNRFKDYTINITESNHD